MTREEQIKQVAEELAEDAYCDKHNLIWFFKKGAEWADKHPSLEKKEVELEKELKTLDDTLFDLDGVAVQGATHYLTVEDIKEIAKHFFELGLKATQKVG